MGKKLKKVWKIVGNISLYFFLVMGLCTIILSVSIKKDADGAMTVFGKQLRFVRSDSMAECSLTDVSDYEIGSIPARTLIWIDIVPQTESEAIEWYQAIQVGDVLTFRYQIAGGQETITHRVVAIEEKAEGIHRVFTLQGDNKGSRETDISVQIIDSSQADTSFNYIIGKVKGKSVFWGWVIYALRSPVGIICLIILPCLIIIGMEVARIIGVIGEEKRTKQKIENEKKDDEIEALKKQLAKLQEEATHTKRDMRAWEESRQGE